MYSSEEMKIYQKDYYKNNKMKQKTYYESYYKNNRLSIIKRQTLYNEKNKGLIKKYQANYYQKRKEKGTIPIIVKKREYNKTEVIKKTTIFDKKPILIRWD